jgi:hypothetical protein
MINREWSFCSIKPFKYSNKSELQNNQIDLTDEEIKNVGHLMKIGKYRKKVIDAFQNGGLIIDDSEWEF